MPRDPATLAFRCEKIFFPFSKLNFQPRVTLEKNRTKNTKIRKKGIKLVIFQGYAFVLFRGMRFLVFAA